MYSFLSSALHLQTSATANYPLPMEAKSFRTMTRHNSRMTRGTTPFRSGRQKRELHTESSMVTRSITDGHVTGALCPMFDTTSVRHLFEDLALPVDVRALSAHLRRPAI
jgi:hypothetical protein